MPRMLFPNLAVADVAASRSFWTALGFGFDERFSDERAAGLAINDLAGVMLLRTDFFHRFHTTEPHTGTEVLMAFDAADDAEVDRLCARAEAAGGEVIARPAANGPMYGGAFRDPDGHIWEVFHAAFATDAAASDH